MPTSLEQCTVRMIKTSRSYVIQRLRKDEYMSAIGHEATAELFSELVKMPIKCQRLNVDLKDGDEVIAFKLKERIPEGKILSRKELNELEYDFFYYNVIVRE